MELLDSVKEIKGIGSKKAEHLEKLGIRTVEEMLLFFPRDYEDRRKTVKIGDAAEGSTVLIKGKADIVAADRYRYGGKQRLRLLVTDDTGSLEVVFFNAKYVKDKFKTGEDYVFYGKISMNFGKKQMLHPEFDKADEKVFSGILPVYPLTKGISQREMRTYQMQIRHMNSMVKDMLTEDMIRENNLCGIDYALENIHFPKEKHKLLEAKYRLIFDESLILQTGLMAARENIKNGKNGIGFSKDVDVRPYIDSFQYKLTGAQLRCIDEIEKDLVSEKVMNRLIQGDVGSGKTAVAETAMYKAAKSGYQSVMMAPTEILARQHFDGISESFRKHGINTGFLSGSVKGAERKETLAKVKNGDIQVLVGTHAVIQEEVEFDNIGLVITDEQHRFGVNQRIKLKNKGKNPNILVMTATPIPRTLAVVMYGDLDVSVIDEMPPGRQKIITRNLKEDDRKKCYDFIEKQLDEGRQAYVVTPLIEKSDEIDAKSVVQIYEELRKRFKGYNTAMLHGAMKQAEKDEIMRRFYEGDIDILAATVVIEVGINVPNATVMVIENAERFGLAQLHQLRGRVGRGKYRSYCFLITGGASEQAEKRGCIMESSSDGFYIAEEDLKLRGPGEIFGTRQHGIPDLKITDMVKHIKVLNHAREEAKKILKKDPMLENEENSILRKRAEKFFGGDFSFNL